MWRVLILFGCLLSPALGASLPALTLAGTTYVSLSDVARLMGLETSDGGQSLTVRASGGVLVIFDRSPDILWRAADGSESPEASDLSLAAPVQRVEGRWFVPAELLGLLGVTVAGDVVTLPGGAEYTLAYPRDPWASGSGDQSDLIDLGNSVMGLALYASGAAGQDSLSLLLVDAALLSLAFPEQQRAIDTFIANLERGRPLYFIVTAVVETPWETTLTFSQNGASFTARYPLTVSVLEGKAGTVSPEHPVAGVVLLPDWLDLRRPMTVRWAEVEGVIQFRR
jgi:hypothetical protein